MNYYKHHLGDYAKDTPSLTTLEHGAYRLLMDSYYATESAIPADEAYALAKAHSPEERAAVDKVLRKFFTLEGSVWQHKRIEHELGLYSLRTERNREVGRLGGRPRKDGQQKPSGFPKETQTVSDEKPNGFQKETLAISHKPITKKKLNTPGADAPRGRFEDFWSTWPMSKRKVAKFEASKVWGSMNLDPIADQIIAHVEAMKTCEQWRDGYDPKPTTYLRGRRWEDGATHTRGSLPSYT